MSKSMSSEDYRMMNERFLSQQSVNIQPYNRARFQIVKTVLLIISWLSLISLCVLACVTLVATAQMPKEEIEFGEMYINKQAVIAIQLAAYGVGLLVSLLPIAVILYEVYGLVMFLAVLQAIGTVLCMILFGFALIWFLFHLYNMIVSGLFFYFGVLLQQKRLSTTVQIPL